MTERAFSTSNDLHVGLFFFARCIFIRSMSPLAFARRLVPTPISHSIQPLGREHNQYSDRIADKKREKAYLLV